MHATTQIDVVVKDIPFRRPPKYQDRNKALQKFFQRNKTEVWLPILLGADKGVDNVVRCLGAYYSLKPPLTHPDHHPVLTCSIVMERCSMTLRDWLKDHPSLSVSTTSTHTHIMLYSITHTTPLLRSLTRLTW